MSLALRRYCLIAVLAMFVNSASAQYFSDQGVMSGSGLTILPTATTVPSTEFRVQWSRMDYVKDNWGGMNVFGIGVGLSKSLEGYLRLASEQMGTAQSQMSYAFGGKFRIPAPLPIVRRLAFWAENTTSDQSNSDALFPSDMFRLGAIVTLDSNDIHPTLQFGIGRTQERTQPLIGAGATVSFGSRVQVGLEAVYGYLELESMQAMGTVSLRVLPNFGIHLSPGYLKTADVSMWTITLGFSVTTSEIDFYPVFEDVEKDGYVLPSIEEMEREDTGKPSGSGSPEGGKSNETSEEQPHE